MIEPTKQITELLNQANGGNKQALDRLLPLVYDELKKVAAKQLSFERSNHTLQPTALVNEAYLVLVKQHSVSWESRIQFFAIASQVMRRILMNYAVAKKTRKRGGGATLIALDEIISFPNNPNIDLIRLNEALEELAEMDAAQCKIVELKFFGGLSNEEVAEVLQIPLSSVKREWISAKAWLLTHF